MNFLINFDWYLSKLVRKFLPFFVYLLLSSCRMVALNRTKVLFWLYWFLVLPLFFSRSIHTFLKFWSSRMYFGLVNAWILFVGKQFKILHFIEIVFLSVLTKLITCNKSIFICLNKRRNDIAYIHGVIFGIVLILFLSFIACWEIIVSLLRFINQRALLPFLFLLLFLFLQKLRISFSLYLQ